jgi:hypothetical protein
MLAGNDTPEILGLEIIEIPVHNKQTIDRISFFKIDLNIAVLGRCFGL